ncbi:MAG: urate hydroxylase PuuD [Gammaproteobacteria bacterium]|nr:urate hydroxylase PuuD [Gammaproteobacteria bacterium]
MQAYLFEWMNLLGRWLHLIAGVAWIGASFYFVWLDNHLLPSEDDQLRNKGVRGELWAVHGGGFYNAHKYAVAPPVLPATLHWFKWEAYATWLSGMFMLCVVYYATADVYLIDRSVANISPALAIGIGLAALICGWLVYDRLCVSALGQQPRLLVGSIALLLAVAAYGLCHIFSGRGAFIHFGAMLGTIMVANVFFVIIPGQRQLVRAKQLGTNPDPLHGQRGTQRSVHNTYFTLPVLFTMISNHSAMTYGSDHNWLVLIAMSVAGAAIRVWFVARHKRRITGSTSPAPLVLGLAALAAVAFALMPTQRRAGKNAASDIDFVYVQTVVKQRCAQCHAAIPSQPGFNRAPKGVLLDTPEQILARTAQIRQQLLAKTMPIGNLTQMTDAERAAVVAWIDAGARR